MHKLLNCIKFWRLSSQCYLVASYIYLSKLKSFEKQIKAIASLSNAKEKLVYENT